MSRLININETSKQLGVSISTLRRWDKAGILIAERTPKGHRRYDIHKINPNLLHTIKDTERKTVAYARVSSHGQKQDLERQMQVLELYCARQGWTFEIISVFSARLYGSRSKKNKKLLETVKEVL